MAGDININEVAIIGDAGAGAREADELAAVVGEGGGAIQQYGRQVLIAGVHLDRARTIVERQAPGMTVTDEAGAIPEAATSGLDEDEALGLEAFALRQSSEYAAAKARRPLDGVPWDSGEAMTPDYPTLERPETAESVPAGARLAGRVTVGLIIVEGPTAYNLQFTAAERTQVVAEVQNG